MPDPIPPVPELTLLEERVTRLESRNKVIGTLIMALMAELVKDVDPTEFPGPSPVVSNY